MTSETTTQEISYGDAVRRQIEHEDVLIVNRLSWLIASQSFLFTAYAIMLNGPVLTRNEHFAAHGELLVKIIRCSQFPRARSSISGSAVESA